METITEDVHKGIESKWSHIGQTRNLDTIEKVEEFLARARFDTDSGKRAEGERRFVEGQHKREEALKRKAVEAGTETS